MSTFQGNIPVTIDHTPRPLARDVSLNHDRPVNVTAAAEENISTHGRFKPTGSANWSIPDAQNPQAARFLEEARRLWIKGEAFTFGYTMAGATFQILTCKISSCKITTNQDGTADMSWDFAGTSLVGPV